MKTIPSILTLMLFITACASTPHPVATPTNVPTHTFPVSIEKLKGLSIQHAETLFQQDLKEHRVDPEEVSLRDYAYRYDGKTHPPLSYEVTRPWMTEKEFGKREVAKSVEGPVDIVIDNPKNFILFYRNIAYLGEYLSAKESKLTVLTIKPFDHAIEEVTAKDSGIKDSLFFNSMILDVDRTLKEGVRNPIAEWEILNGVDPENAKELGRTLGIEG